ncbi:MAG: hypothetical protein ACLP05_06270 [Candidatus Kryptoniota bacterium]
METNEGKSILGIITDEEPMFDLLSKFLKKEGYEARRVLHNMSECEDYALVIYAPARGSSHSKTWFENLKKRRPTLLVVQSYDEEFFDDDDNVVKLSDRPLNLRQLSETIKKQLSSTSLSPSSIDGLS